MLNTPSSSSLLSRKTRCVRGLQSGGVLLTSMVLAGLLTRGVVAAPPGFSAEDEAVYQQRFATLMESFRLGLGLETYDPLESVPGSVEHKAFPVVDRKQATIAAEALDQAREYAAANRSIALLVWQGGQLQLASYFKGGEQDTFASRSLAKPMTAVAVGRAIERGDIRSLDQPISDFISEWRNDPERSKIRVRHLLDMRSGLLPQAVATTAEDVLNRAYLHPRHDEVILREYPLVHEPGSRYEYNNATSELVALLIKRATGRRYAEFLSTEVLQPLGAMGGDVWVNRPGGTAHSGCCLLLPPESWLRLGLLLMNDGVWQGKRLLPAGYVDEMRRGTAQNPYYGLGVYVGGRYIERRGFANPERDRPELRVFHSEPYLADDVFLFDGNANQVVYLIPSADMVIVRVGQPPPKAEGKEWDNSYLPNVLLRGWLSQSPGVSLAAQPRD